MSRGLGRVESKILLYFNMASRGCNLDDCEYLSTCHYHKEPKERDIDVSEPCYLVGGFKRCPAEGHPFEKYTTSTYKGVLRALKSLERKGYIKGQKKTAWLKESFMPPWYMLYKLNDDYTAK